MLFFIILNIHPVYTKKLNDKQEDAVFYNVDHVKNTIKNKHRLKSSLTLYQHMKYKKKIVLLFFNKIYMCRTHHTNT